MGVNFVNKYQNLGNSKSKNKIVKFEVENFEPSHSNTRIN